MSDENDIQMTVGEHLEELRARVLSSIMALFGVLVICLLDQNFYMNIILKPHINAMKALNLKATIQVLRYEESFFSHLKIAITAGLILTMPFILYQIWLFVSVGLKESEKKYVRFIFPFTLIFFITGVLFGYFILIPLGLRFLGSYGSVNIHVGFTLSSYISLFFILTFVSGIIFELPLVMLILVKLNILSSYFFIQNWRYSVLIAFVISALLTPPDVVTQLLMAGPIILLYFSGIVVCRFSERFSQVKEFFLRV